MKYSRARTPLAIAALLGSLSCSKATPVAPSGSVLSISANPSQISLNGESTITIFGSKANGSPLDPGTVIRLSTNLGTIDGTTTVKSGGTATATLRGDGRSGQATVMAATGAGTAATAMTMVQIGIATGQKPTLLVSASPSNVAVDGTVTVTVIARNSDGSPVSDGQEVILTSSLGTFRNSRPKTKGGTATATLDAGSQAGTATITAVLGASDAATTTVTIRDAAVAIGLVANPSSISYSSGTSGSTTLMAFVTNSQGLPVAGAAVVFSADKSVTFDHTQAFTDSNGQATAVMTVQSSQVPSGTVIMVTARTTSGTGGALTATIPVPVN